MTNMKLVRKAQADDCMEVDGDEGICSSDVDLYTKRCDNDKNYIYHFRNGQ